jgi:hypothetical protein
LIHGASDTEPGLIVIAAGESAALESTIRATNLNVLVVGAGFPIFIGPVKNESAHADLLIFRGQIGFKCIPLFVEEGRDRYGTKK